MSELTSELIDDVLALCGQNAARIAEVLSRVLDVEVSVTVGGAGVYDQQAPPEGYDAGGLAIAMQVADVAMVALLPESSRLLPAWAREADSPHRDKLDELAEQLAQLAMPASMSASGFSAAWVDNLSESLTNAEVRDGASMVPLVLEAAGEKALLSLVWPCEQPAKLLPTRESKQPESKPTDGPAPAESKKPIPKRLEELPPYAKHLLKISVPVSVRLVTKKVSVKEVLELGPGAMVSFEKSCDGPLELTVGNQVVAEGAAVKVGERFGLQIEKMTLPGEHFWPVRKQA